MPRAATPAGGVAWRVEEPGGRVTLRVSLLRASRPGACFVLDLAPAGPAPQP